MKSRFYVDPETGEPHIFRHGVSQAEVDEVLAGPGEDLAARNNTRMKLGQTQAGRYLAVIYVPDVGHESLFVITAREMMGKAKKALRRRQRRRRP